MCRTTGETIILVMHDGGSEMFLTKRYETQWMIIAGEAVLSIKSTMLSMIQAPLFAGRNQILPLT